MDTCQFNIFIQSMNSFRKHYHSECKITFEHALQKRGESVEWKMKGNILARKKWATSNDSNTIHAVPPQGTLNELQPPNSV
jgi:hypothetical protein